MEQTYAIRCNDCEEIFVKADTIQNLFARLLDALHEHTTIGDNLCEEATENADAYDMAVEFTNGVYEVVKAETTVEYKPMDD